MEHVEAFREGERVERRRILVTEFVEGQDGCADPVRGSRVGASLGAYSIRIPQAAGPVPCRSCGRIFKAGGPTGFLNSDPICDGCLLAGDRQLGMVLTMIAVCRFYGTLVPANAREERLHQREMLAFARVYRRFAARFGRARPWSDFLKGGGSSS